MVPVEYGGMGLDQISYGLIMQEIERCDSGLRSLCSGARQLGDVPDLEIRQRGTENEVASTIWPQARTDWVASVLQSRTTVATPAAWSPPSRTKATITC
jgi:alkylation response protein AidB-like acyl-CoA dehydrogenase